MSRQIYDMELITETSCTMDKGYDYFLLAPNIEKRSRKLFREFRECAVFHKIISMDYANFHKEISEEQEAAFYEDFASASFITIKADNDTAAIRQLCGIGIKSSNSVAIDITGFSIPNIFRIIAILKNIIRIRHLDIFYTEPQFYIYEEGYFDSYHPNIGERNCAPISGYYNAGEDEKEILTIFLGFDGGLADLVYFRLGEEGKEILQTLAVNGFPSYTPKLKDVSLFNNEDLINKIGKGNIFYAAANNPFETYNLLCRIMEMYRGTLLNLCTIGSKPMALGVCLFALEHPDQVKVTYPFYEKRRFDVDEEAGKTWKYGVDFD